MRKLFFAFLLLLGATLASAEEISSIETRNGWVYLYNARGSRYRTLSLSSTGNVVGYSSTFFVTEKGGWIYLYDADGRRYKTLAQSSVGNVTGVAGDTFTSRKGNWIYTWDKTGKRLNTRAAR